MKAREKERSRRYDTANGLANDIERFLNEVAVEACPPSLGYQVRKFVVRHRGLVTTASLVMAAVVLGMIGTTAGMLKARHDAGVARDALAEADRSRDLARTLANEKEREAKLAIQAKQEADQLRDAAKARAAQQLIMRAAAERDRGDITLAALLGVEALQQDTGDAEWELNHRRRLAADLRECPRPTRVLMHEAKVNDARYSSDGKWIVTACQDGVVRIFNAATGETVRTLEHEGEARRTTFVLNDTRLLTHELLDKPEDPNLYERGKVHLWDWRSGKKLESTTVLPQSDLWDEDFHKRSTYAIVSGRRERMILSAADGQPVGPPLQTEWDISLDSKLIGPTSMLLKLAKPDDTILRGFEAFRTQRFAREARFEIWHAEIGKRITLVPSDPVQQIGGRFESLRASVVSPINPQGKQLIAFGSPNRVEIFVPSSG